MNEKIPLAPLGIEDYCHQREVLKKYKCSNFKILIAAACMSPEEFCDYMRFPEVIFVDATHKTNNEGRPLFLVFGRDSNGKAFIIIKIFMPNETASFYRWVFLDAIPSMLGKNNLLRTNFIITDGDSQEINAVNESFFLYFSNTIHDRCGYHRIEKSYKDHVSGNYIFINEEKAKCIILEIKIWVRSWINGDTCLHHNQYKMSKNMLLSYIGHD